jgi:hypothetical protein
MGIYILRDFLKFSSTLALFAVLYNLVWSVLLFMGLESLPSDWTDSMLSVLHDAGNLSERARHNGDAAVLSARL